MQSSWAKHSWRRAEEGLSCGAREAKVRGGIGRAIVDHGGQAGCPSWDSPNGVVGLMGADVPLCLSEPVRRLSGDAWCGRLGLWWRTRGQWPQECGRKICLMVATADRSSHNLTIEHPSISHGQGSKEVRQLGCEVLNQWRVWALGSLSVGIQLAMMVLMTNMHVL
jgi:hypothetical protein